MEGNGSIPSLWLRLILIHGSPAVPRRAENFPEEGSWPFCVTCPEALLSKANLQPCVSCQ